MLPLSLEFVKLLNYEIIGDGSHVIFPVGSLSNCKKRWYYLDITWVSTLEMPQVYADLRQKRRLKMRKCAFGLHQSQHLNVL